MPTPPVVRRYWALVLVALGKFDNIDEALGDSCFACGFDDWSVPQRAHITARVNGGPDTADNLHMLCDTCHKASERLDGEPYWVWLVERTIVDRCLQAAASSGVNLGSLAFGSTLYRTLDTPARISTGDE